MTALARRLCPMPADRGWQRRFDDPIPLPRGRQLVTLEDAGNYITNAWLRLACFDFRNSVIP
jgi:hypothetical protein